MRARWMAIILLVGSLACVCLAGSLVLAGGRLKHTPGIGPVVRIIDPHYGDRVRMERAVLVQAEARDSSSLVTKVELWVDGQLLAVQSSGKPQGSPYLLAAQGWQPSSPGSHTLMVRAQNSRGTFGQAMIVVEAVEGLFGFGDEGEELYLGDVVSAEYVVSEGDTLQDVALGHDASQESLLQLNPGLDVEEPLQEGQIVEVPFDPEILWGEGEPGEESRVGPQIGPAPEPPEPPVVVPEPPEVLLSESAPVELIVTNLTLSNLNPEPGEEIVVGVTILNAGGTPAEGFYWAWDPGTGEGWIEDESPIGLLVPGDDVVREMTYAYQWAGHFSGQVLADAQGAYDEPDEDNNLAEARVTVGEDRPFSPLDPIASDWRGDLLRLLWRIRHGQGGRGGDGGDTPDLEQPPAPPSLETSHEGCEVAVQWCSNSVNEEGFYLYRWDTTTGGDFEQIADFPPTQGCATWSDGVPKPGEYYYQLVASNEFGEGTSDVVREQVTYEECQSVGCNFSVLELEVEGGLVGQSVVNVYCYAALDDLPEERVPPGQDEFFSVDANQLFNIADYLSGQNSRLVTVPSDQELRVFAECWGWASGEQDPFLLGEFTSWHGEEDWDGSTLYGDGGGFRAEYSISRVASAGCVEVFEYPYVPETPYGVTVAPAYRLGLGAQWTWVGQESAIEGFWILCDGDKVMWVDKDDSAMMKREGHVYVSPALPDWIADPGCLNGCNLSVIAGYKNEPYSSHPDLNSPPSESYPWFDSSCAEVTVSVDTFEFTSLHFTDNCVETYGYVSVNGYKRTMDGVGDPEIPLTMCEGDAGGVWDVSGADYFDITVKLDADEPLYIDGGLWEVRPGLMYAEEGKICSGLAIFDAAPPEVWARVDSQSVHYLVGQGEAGSCKIGFTLHYGTPAH